MPLTSANRVYKSFPNIFAENVTQHVKRRAESYRKCRNQHDLVLQNIDDAEIAEVCDKEEKEEVPQLVETSAEKSSKQNHSRLTPEMRMLRTRPVFTTGYGVLDSDSENSSTATTPSTTPRSRTSPSPRGVPVKIIESPRPLHGGSFVPAFTSPRKSRFSPRTTCSLDNVDLWEESDSESDSQKVFDTIEGVTINPSKTFDLSDLRRSRSPVACKRNKLIDERPTIKDRSKSRSNERRESRSATKSRARVNRRLKAMFVNTRVTKPPQTIQESNENDENDTLNRSSDPPLDKTKLLSNRSSRIAANFSNLKSKSDVFETKTDISKLEKSVRSHLPNLKNNRPTYSAKTDRARMSTEDDELSLSVPGSSKSHLLNQLSTTVSSPIKDARPQANTTKPESYALNRLKQTPTSRSPYGSPSETRRVKFNSFVTVREDELSTLEFLKKSTDTARQFKNRYLNAEQDDMECSNAFAQTIH